MALCVGKGRVVVPSPFVSVNASFPSACAKQFLCYIPTHFLNLFIVFDQSQ